MCTVSWTAIRDGYELFFNRDELNSRAAEEPPALGNRNGVAYVAPRDGAHGGTWLAVNEFGLTICLLNDYGAPWRPPADQSRFSRGHLVLNCAGAKSHAEVMTAIHEQPLSRTMPFQLIAVSPIEGALVVGWQGHELKRHAAGNVGPPVSSSSFATSEVIAGRVRRFADFVRSPREAAVEELTRYHRQHDRAAGAHSVLMCRDDAATRSICRVTVDNQCARLVYQPVRWTDTGPRFSDPLRSELDRIKP
jgi:hypothetical protein